MSIFCRIFLKKKYEIIGIKYISFWFALGQITSLNKFEIFCPVIELICLQVHINIKCEGVLLMLRNDRSAGFMQ